ncbi:helix-turn-helix domain-containing protein [Bacillus mycoides]|uniref:helix-turn-helix domain-containing protein n=1 Tax=Bacillus mycoides TaxID=1405 RepID=UPI003F7C8ADE
MKEIEKYMSPSEAAYRWGIPETTLKNYLQGKTKGNLSLEQLIEMGYLKYFIKPGGKRKEWIIHEEVMNTWFPKKQVMKRT